MSTIAQIGHWHVATLKPGQPDNVNQAGLSRAIVDHCTHFFNFEDLQPTESEFATYLTGKYGGVFDVTADAPGVFIARRAA